MAVGDEVKNETGLRNGREIARRLGENHINVQKGLKALGAKVSNLRRLGDLILTVHINLVIADNLNYTPKKTC